MMEIKLCKTHHERLLDGVRQKSVIKQLMSMISQDEERVWSELKEEYSELNFNGANISDGILTLPFEEAKEDDGN